MASTPLIDLFKSKDKQAISLFLDEQINKAKKNKTLDKWDKQDKSALYYAAISGEEEAVAKLLDAGATMGTDVFEIIKSPNSNTSSSMRRLIAHHYSKDDPSSDATEPGKKVILKTESKTESLLSRLGKRVSSLPRLKIGLKKLLKRSTHKRTLQKNYNAPKSTDVILRTQTQTPASVTMAPQTQIPPSVKLAPKTQTQTNSNWKPEWVTCFTEIENTKKYIRTNSTDGHQVSFHDKSKTQFFNAQKDANHNVTVILKSPLEDDIVNALPKVKYIIEQCESLDSLNKLIAAHGFANLQFKDNGKNQKTVHIIKAYNQANPNSQIQDANAAPAPKPSHVSIHPKT